MGISSHPSVVCLPQVKQPYPTILEFLCIRFPAIHLPVWQSRMTAGKILDDALNPITATAPYVPGKKIYYFREVAEEQVIPFAEKILFQNDTLLVACKPHFLPVIPSGRYVEECLLHRLRQITGNDDLVPIHRIDRETAGIVMFSVNKATRAAYHQLFMYGQVEKTYEALSECDNRHSRSEWLVETRIERAEPWFLRKTVPGQVNARSQIYFIGKQGKYSHFYLRPFTGKTHQLRLHMSELGFPIVNDCFYPRFARLPVDDFAKPLQLIARKVRFIDPLTSDVLEFSSERKLLIE